jgi:hypothetical protein
VLKVVHLKRLHSRLAGEEVPERVERVERELRELRGLGDGTKSRSNAEGGHVGERVRGEDRVHGNGGKG